MSKVTSKVEFTSFTFPHVCSLLLLYTDLFKHHYNYCVSMTLCQADLGSNLASFGAGFMKTSAFLRHPMVCYLFARAFVRIHWQNI